jgi:hypothetical protein
MENIMKYALLIFALFLASCASVKYPNWEHVRIERSIPSDQCKYIIQESCSKRGSECYEWFKKRATKFDANTVVITQSKEGFGITGAFGSFSVGNTLTAMADYYDCPKK